MQQTCLACFLQLASEGWQSVDFRTQRITIGENRSHVIAVNSAQHFTYQLANDQE